MEPENGIRALALSLTLQDVQEPGPVLDLSGQMISIDPFHWERQTSPNAQRLETVPLRTLQELDAGELTCVQLDGIFVLLMLNWLSRAVVQDVTMPIKWLQEDKASSLLLRLEGEIRSVTLFLGHSTTSLDVELMVLLPLTRAVLH
jgi:hypothetical protein